MSGPKCTGADGFGPYVAETLPASGPRVKAYFAQGLEMHDMAGALKDCRRYLTQFGSVDPELLKQQIDDALAMYELQLGTRREVRMTPPTRLIIELTNHPSEAVLTVLRMGEQLRNERNHREGGLAKAPVNNHGD